MSYYVCVTVNTPKREFELLFPEAESLDNVLALVKGIHKNAASFVFSIVSNNKTETER